LPDDAGLAWYAFTMGEIIRDVAFYDLVGGLDDVSIVAPRPVVTVAAFIDSGSSRTIVSRKLVEDVRSIALPGTATYGRRSFPQRLMAARLDGAGCEIRLVMAVVADRLIAEADVAAEIILGHDYLQAARVGLRFSERASGHVVDCMPARRRARAKRTG
jgi:hypothetical protein